MLQPNLIYNQGIAMRLVHSHKLNQTGDTIVEVLIAIAVVSVVIVSSFTIANKSSIQIRAAQERSEGLKLAASAIETIKARPTAANNLPLNKLYCQDLITQATANGDLPNLVTEQDSDYAQPQCRSQLTTVPYFISVMRTDNEGSFVVHARWDRVGGGERQDITYSYRLNP